MIILVPFDFYIPDENLCIECQGQMHYYAVEHFGGEEKLNKIKHNDSIKKEYCKNNNIKLLCLPYTLTIEEMKKEILNILDPVTITE